MPQDYKNYLNLLNNQQREAVLHTEGANLVLAGAGSGKTRVLIYKLLHILIEKKATPDQIMAVTFTNKAALEMKSRVIKLFGNPVDTMWLGTFHSLSLKILKKHAELVGLKSNFTILDTDDQLNLVKQICKSLDIDTKEKSPKYYLNIIDNSKNKLTNFQILRNYNDINLEKIFKLYQSELLRLNCVDFSDLLLHCLNIFGKNKEVLEIYQNKFKYILVDEYQDINNIQQKWLEYLYKKNKNICCVGDDDQSIYSWRGANVSNLLSFEKNFDKSKIFRLEQNYRSSKNILKCASNLIKNNKDRYGKELWSQKENGEKIIITGFWETKEEAMFVSDEIEKIISEKKSLNEIAILFRVAAHTRSFEDRFINLGLPYKIIGGLRFYERKEIKDIIAYLRLVNNLNDDLAFERIINVPKRGVGATTLSKIRNISRINNLSMFESTELYIRESTGKNKLEINDFLSKVYKWNKFKEESSHEDLANIILEDSNYIKFLEEEASSSKNPEKYSRLDNIQEFLESLKDFENLEGFLEHVSLVMENISNTSNESINLMTMHAAKGLEFNYVFLAGWEEGVFPSKRSIEETGKLGLEEERRLAYVAITRAKNKLFITYVNQNRFNYGTHDYNKPSRFISELPQDIIEIKDSSYLENQDFLSNFDESESFEINISPGRKRLIDNRSKNEILWDFNQDNSNQGAFEKGKKVFHQKFGYGIILNLEGDTAKIDFEKSSQKQVFIKYLEIVN